MACVNESIQFTELLRLFQEFGSTGEAEKTCEGLTKTIQNPGNLAGFLQGRANSAIRGGSVGGILGGLLTGNN